VKRLRYDPQAEEELNEAAQRYGAADVTVAERFVARVVATVTEIRRAPHLWPLDPNVPEHLGVRRRVVPDFPYLVLFKEYSTEVVIIAVAHGKRAPGYWRRRLLRT
jgi:plasmid stabilization system protein ParE